MGKPDERCFTVLPVFPLVCCDRVIWDDLALVHEFLQVFSIERFQGQAGWGEWQPLCVDRGSRDLGKLRDAVKI